MIHSLQQICKYGSAFLNSGGGVIYFGILDNGNETTTILAQLNVFLFVSGMIEGIYLTLHKMDRLSKQIEDIFLQFDPCVGREFYQ